MINKIKIAFVALLVTVATTSCSDWLYLEPADGVITEEYWQSEADLKSGVMGIYASMLGNNASGSYSVAELMVLWGEVRADMMSEYKTVNVNFSNIVNGELKATNQFAKWNSIYRTINYCNTVLEKAPVILELDASMTTEKMNQYRAEALTVRAMMYLLLNKVYREVPLLTTATTSDDGEMRVAKVTDQSELWNQIEADLKEAEQYAVTSYGSTVAEEKGRITKYTVWSVMADFYLWRSADGDAGLAETACNNIISAKKFSLVNADANWFYYLYYKGNSLEGIFELQYEDDILNPFYSNFFTVGYYHANADAMAAIFPDDPLVDSDSLDIRADRGSYRAGLSYAIWKYIGITNTELNAPSEARNNLIVYRYADILLMKAEALALQVNDSDPSTLTKAAESLVLINQVRDRARASSLNSEGTPTDRNGLLTYILNERAREFAFEGKRWFDLLRMAKRDNYAKKSLLIDMLDVCAPATRLVSIKAKMQDPNYHYMPIPQSDIDAGYPYLIQNPFYAE